MSIGFLLLLIFASFSLVVLMDVKSAKRSFSDRERAFLLTISFLGSVCAVVIITGPGGLPLTCAIIGALIIAGAESLFMVFHIVRKAANLRRGR